MQEVGTNKNKCTKLFRFGLISDLSGRVKLSLFIRNLNIVLIAAPFIVVYLCNSVLLQNVMQLVHQLDTHNTL